MSYILQGIQDDLRERRERYAYLLDLLADYPKYKGTSIFDYEQYCDKRSDLAKEFEELAADIQNLESQKQELQKRNNS